MRERPSGRARRRAAGRRRPCAPRRRLCGNQPVCRVRPTWLGRAARNRHRHTIEQASRRWRGGRRDDSARTRRKILISTQVVARRRERREERLERLLVVAVHGVPRVQQRRAAPPVEAPHDVADSLGLELGEQRRGPRGDGVAQAPSRRRTSGRPTPRSPRPARRRRPCARRPRPRRPRRAPGRGPRCRSSRPEPRVEIKFQAFRRRWLPHRVLRAERSHARRRLGGHGPEEAPVRHVRLGEAPAEVRDLLGLELGEAPFWRAA